MNRNRLLVPDGQTVAGGGFGTVDGHFAFDHLDPHAAFRGNLVNRLLIFQQRPAIEFHILVHLQRAISRIRRQHQLFALGGVEAALLVARGNAGFFRNNPDLIQTQTIGFARVVLRVAHPGTRAHDLELARRLGDRERCASAAIRLARFYSSRGACIEARQLLDSIRRELPPGFLELYYRTYIFFYDCYGVFSGSSRPTNNRAVYRDSLRRHLGIPANTSETREQAEQRLLNQLTQIPPGTPDYAMIANSLGSHYRANGDDWLAKKYYTLSAIADIQNATKENDAILSLAKVYFEHKDYSRAYKYTQSALEDALCSNMQFRIVRMTELASIIIASHQDKEAKTKVKLQHYLILISVLSAVLILLFVFVYKQVRKLSRVRKELSGTNAELARLNIELNEINEQLSDANAVKVQYIARFFDLCSMYIDKMDNYRKSLKKLAQERQPDELYRRLKSTSMLENEQEELFRNFDEIFLNLYPTFIEEFNELLVESERITPKSGDLLNKELRIYALIRLGITDSVRIASFLRCSLSTVYNYRTRMRNRAAASREDFEKKVMKIGGIHRNDA